MLLFHFRKKLPAMFTIGDNSCIIFLMKAENRGD